jgi:hypothetical protein
MFKEYLSYEEGGIFVSVPILPEQISVYPDPLLVIDYFWPRVVFSDDPFTDEIEPSISFPIGTLVQNKGRGSAKYLKKKKNFFSKNLFLIFFF